MRRKAEAPVTLIERIEKQLVSLPPEKQNEVLDFIELIRDRPTAPALSTSRLLRDHPAFGSWKSRRIDALTFQEELRAEWGSR